MTLTDVKKAGVRRRKKEKRYPDTKAAICFLLPSMLGIIIFFLLPFADTIRRSFYDALGKQFRGFQNYSAVLQNESFQLAAANTAKFLCICLPLLMALSLVFALMMRMVSPGGRRIKTMFLLPMAVPVSSMVLVWKLLFHERGLANGLLVSLGAEPVNFMGTGAAFWVLVATYVWKNCGYDMVLWLSGLDGISESQYEAARVDGAGAVRCFVHITMPSLLPTCGLVSIISLLNGFKVFREAYLVSGAYPHDSIYLLQHLFNNWFSNMDISRLCAAAVILCTALLGVILVIQKFLRSRD